MYCLIYCVHCAGDTDNDDNVATQPYCNPPQQAHNVGVVDLTSEHIDLVENGSESGGEEQLPGACFEGGHLHAMALTILLAQVCTITQQQHKGFLISR